MNPPIIPADGREPTESLVDLLTASDETLAAGGTLGPPASAPLPPQEQELLGGALACLRRLENVWPRGEKGTGTFSAIGVEKVPVPFSTALGAHLTAASPESGEPVKLGRFLLHQSLGSGGFGTVFLATDTTLHRQVALKLPRLEVSLQPELRRRFLLEARAAAVLDHPHIVPVHEAGEIDSLCYIASPYIKGPNLSTWLKARAPASPSPRSAALLVAQLAEAVAFVHERGIVHRDLKPGNILLQEVVGSQQPVASEPPPANTGGSPCLLTDYIPKITDFGLARFQEAQQGETRSGVAFGTPAYMPPEQAQGHWSEVGPAVDIYSLGAILYELLTGKAPFQGQTELDVQYQVVHQEPIAPHRLRRGIPRDLEVICSKCLAKRPGDRYASAAKLAADLRSFLVGEAIAARPRSIVQRGWKQLVRRPATAASALFFLVAFGLAGGFWAWEAAQLRHAARRTRVDDYIRAIGEANEALSRMDYPVVGELLNRLRPKPGEVDLRGFEWRILQQEFWNAGPRFRVLPQNIGPIAFSPDGRYLAADCNQAIELLNAGTGESVAILRGHTDSIHSLLFSPDGNELASSSKDGSLRFWRVPSGKERLRFAELPDFFQMATSRDGNLFALGHHAGIWAGNWTGSKAPRRYEHLEVDDPSICALSPDGKLLAVGSKRGLSWHDAADGRLLAEHPKIPIFYPALALSKDGRYLAYSGDDTLTVYDVPHRQALATRYNRRGRMFSCAFLPDGRRLMTCKAPDPGTPGAAEFQILDWRTNNVLASTSEAAFTSAVAGGNLALSPDGRIVAMGCARGIVRYWLPDGAGRVQAPAGHDSEVWCLAYSPDGRMLASGGDDNMVKLWDRGTGRQIAALPHPDLVVSLAISPDGAALAAGCYGGSVHLWDLVTKTELWVNRESQSPIRRTQFAPDGGLILTAGDSKALIALNRADGTERFRLNGAGDAELSSLAQARDGSRLFAGDGRGVLHAWEAGTGRLLWEKVDFPVFLDMALSPDGTRLASSHIDGSVRILNPNDGSVERILHKHKESVRALAFSPDGRTLASAGADHQVRLWHLETGRELLDLAGPTRQVNSLAFSPDGLLLAAACHDGRIYQWQGIASDSGPPPALTPSPAPRGDGDFGTTRTTPSPGEVEDLSIAELENHGTLGIAALCRDGEAVECFRMKENRQLEAYARIPASRARRLALADLNNDGALDLACSLSNGVQIHWSKSGLRFNQPSSILPAGSATGFLAAGDFDGDGRLDLLYVQPEVNELGVLLSRQGDAFASMPGIKTSAGPTHIAVAHVDGDGKLDLVVACAGSDCVCIHRGKGDGTFYPSKTLATGKRPTWVTLADLNGDGKPDIIVAQEGDNSLGVFIGKGNGEFGVRQNLPAGKGCCAVVAADLNDDGIMDLAAVNHDDATLSIFLGKGNGVFKPARHFPTGKGPHRLAVADLDRDGLKDIVVGCKEGKALEVHFGCRAK